MKTIRFGLALALTTLGGSAFAHCDESHPIKPSHYVASKLENRASGRERAPDTVARTIQVDMSDAFRFNPDDVVIKGGETVKFVVSNSGKQLHEMVLGTPEELSEHVDPMRKFPGMEHAGANMAHVEPGTKGEIVWQFAKAGTYKFACLIPGHSEAGMFGKVVVK